MRRVRDALCLRTAGVGFPANGHCAVDCPVDVATADERGAQLAIAG
jgi:hypothetical protein